MYLIGYDIGSSSVKACLLDALTGRVVASDFYPKTEMPIRAEHPGWAEQDPEMWWTNLKQVHQAVLQQAGIDGKQIKAIGISWQMHGLVLVDKQRQVLRPSIIWCDSRAVPYGEKAFEEIGKEKCLSQLLNSPGNFTAAKLAWVKANEPQVYEQIYKFMLPGDYIALKLCGETTTTPEALSEGIFWDFQKNALSEEIMHYFGFDRSFVPDLRPTFGYQGEVTALTASELGLKPGTPVCYRAGDQPNNALSLNVLNPGEVASTAGTSGVVYGVRDCLNFDPESRVNTFAHVNHTPEHPRLGTLLCINGTGILYAWLRKNFVSENTTYQEMNILAEQSIVGAQGITVIPFGNGAERMLQNLEPNCSIQGINFNIHGRADILRAAQEGIVFSFQYGMEIMQQMGMSLKTIRAGRSNLFLSPIFRQTLASTSGVMIELYETDGAAGAARGAGIGAGIYSSPDEAFSTLKRIQLVEPEHSKQIQYEEAYLHWKQQLQLNLQHLKSISE